MIALFSNAQSPSWSPIAGKGRGKKEEKLFKEPASSLTQLFFGIVARNQTMHSILEYKSRECKRVEVRVGKTTRGRFSLPLHTLDSDRVSSGIFISSLKLLTVKDLKIEAT